MKRIVTHPDNLPLLKREIDRQGIGGDLKSPYGLPGSLWGIRVQTNELMERDKPSGKYKMPDGRVVPAAQVKLRDRFCEYGPEDISWLVYAGLIQELREPLFMVLDDFRLYMDWMPKIAMPSALLMNSF